MKTRTRHCLPIIESSHDRIREIISHNRSSFAFFEIWLDYLTAPDTAFFISLTTELPGAIIFITRRLKLEPIKRPYQERLDFVAALQGQNCLFDFDIRTQLDELEALRSNNNELQRLISYHNYDATPATEQLEDVLEQMQRFQPVVSKIACYCRSESDSLRLLQLLLNCASKRDVIILGMGEHGLATRILGPLYGNCFTFSPVTRERESAPGQLTHSELESILEVIARARE